MLNRLFSGLSSPKGPDTMQAQSPAPLKSLASPIASASAAPASATTSESTLTPVPSATTASPVASTSQSNPQMPVVGTVFRNRSDFESACRRAIPSGADWTLKVWKSLEENTAKKWNKSGFVELGCTHIRPNGNVNCHFSAFGLRAIRHDNGNWVVIKSLTKHESGPSIQKARPKPRAASAKAASAKKARSDSEELDAVQTPPAKRARLSRAAATPTNKRSPVKRKRQDDGFFLPTAVPKVQGEVYCYCHYSSYDDMVKCSGEFCKHQWFHLGCIGLPVKPAEGSWQCFDCLSAPKPGRSADKLVQLHSGAMNMLAAATLPLDTAPHGPVVAFLNSLNPTLGDTAGQQVYDSGITSPQRLQGMSVEEWEAFHRETLTKTSLTNFDLYTLRRTISAWIQNKGYSAVNQWS